MSKPHPIIVAALVLTTAASSAAAVSDLRAYVIADAAETEETTPTDDALAGAGDYICYDCKIRFETEEEYVKHVEAEHPEKWETMKSDYEGWFEKYETETESRFELSPYAKLALLGSAFAAAWVIIHYVDKPL